MLVIAIIIIILLVLNFVADILYNLTKNKYIKVMKQQNTVLWAVVEESRNLMAEALKEAEKADARTQK